MTKSKMLIEDDPNKTACTAHQWVMIESTKDSRTFSCALCGETNTVPIKESAGGKRLLLG